MNRLSIQEEQPVPTNKTKFHDTLLEQQYQVSDQKKSYGSLFEDLIDTPQALSTPQDLGHVFCQQVEYANDLGQSQTTGIHTNDSNPILNALQPSCQTSGLSDLGETAFLKDVDPYLEAPFPEIRDSRQERSYIEYEEQVFGQQSISRTRAYPQTSYMQPLPHSASRHSSAPPQAIALSKYDTFRGCFPSAHSAKQYRHDSMRFDRQPCRDPSSDPTIADVEAHRHEHVERIYNAMIRSDIARDNPNSTALKRWVYDAHYPSLMVESYAHKVFDALLEQVKHGFRGWHQNDYVVDERKGDDEDRDIDCIGRLENIISALEQEKSICENVMASSSQIRMFVNAPKAYSKRKDQNRVGNGKRLNARGELPEGKEIRPAKRRKTGSRQVRARSTTVSDMPSTCGATPQQEIEPSGLPYFASRPSQIVGASPTTTPFRAPQAPTVHMPFLRPHTNSFGSQSYPQMMQHGMSIASQPQTTHSHIARIASLPPIQQTSLMSPPSRPHDHKPAFVASTSVRPTDVKPSDMSLFNDWQSKTGLEGNFHNDPALHSTIAETLQSEPFTWPEQSSDFASTQASANLFEHYPELGVSLADIEQHMDAHTDWAHQHQQH
ncbi:hypothetical protein ACN47E_009939 [Coniothyrium glycines]